jgi:hypothetical protein
MASNDLVDGAANETAPIELVRQTSNVGALRLLVNLYHEQALQLDGGVHWRKIRKNYKREKIGESGSLIIWGFSHTNESSPLDSLADVPF